MRHPLYSVGSSFFIALALMADSWFIASLAVRAFLLLALRTPNEEAHLIKRFGDEYQANMEQTGAYFPKLGR